jgi:hypothetical protein
MKIKLGDRITGPAGVSQQLLVTPDPSDPPDWTSSIGTWFIDAPGQSPAWRHYMLSAVHLRPIDGVKPAVISEPGATHEFMMLAMDPEKNPDPLDPKTWSFLRPCNLTEQVTLPNDAAAGNLLGICATRVAAGILWAEPMLSGQVEPWRSFLRGERGVMSDEEVQEDLALDLRVYGSCYWKIVDGRKVRIHPYDIRYIKGEPRDSTNTVASSATRSNW